MCGFAGFWDPTRDQPQADLRAVALSMGSALRHRGPDSQGSWVDASAGVALAHRRLAILDLTDEGHQPMHSADQRFVLSYNGEVYNHDSLRGDLLSRGHAFRGRSDTEVMLAAFSEWGVEAALKRFVGMFAFAAWDRHNRLLWLGRDRAGEKPLYYGWTGGVFLFGSELKALRMHPAWRGTIDTRAVALQLRYNNVPTPLSIYQGVQKLPPGAFLRVSEAHLSDHSTPTPTSYWSLENVFRSASVSPFQGSAHHAVENLHSLLKQSVASQLVSDVPLGAFLSGGIDSSTIVALMQERVVKPVRTFCIGFDEKRFDEAPYAKAVAAHLGTDHTELYVGARDLQHVIPRLASVYDEPFADSSQIPTVLLCELARRHVTVSLSGDGGDELFAGYERYFKTSKLWSAFKKLPPWVRAAAADKLTDIADCAGWLPPGAATRFLSRVQNLSDLLGARDDRHLYHEMMSPCREPAAWLAHTANATGPFSEPSLWESVPGLIQRMMWQDFITYLPDDILVKVDRAAMSVSLETRVPLLDHRVVEFAWSVPPALYESKPARKWMLRQVLSKYVPDSLIDRPKQGFGVPIAAWLRGPLREWSEELLNEKRLRDQGIFAVEFVRERWGEHQENRRDWSLPLWHLLMFQAWFDAQSPATYDALPTTSRVSCDRQPCNLCQR